MACPLAHAYFEANSAHYEAKTAHSERNLPVILMGCNFPGLFTSGRCHVLMLSSLQEFSKFLFSLIANDRQTQPFINTNTRIDCVDRKSSLRLAFDRLSERRFAP